MANGLTADMARQEPLLLGTGCGPVIGTRNSPIASRPFLGMTRSIQSCRIARFAPIETSRCRLRTLELLIAAAQSAATTSNLQAWSVIAVEDPARKARLASFAANQRHIVDAPLLLVFVADLARLRSISDERGHPGIALNYIEAFIFAIADASFAAQNTIVAAESLGLGGCYIGAMRNNPAGGRRRTCPAR